MRVHYQVNDWRKRNHFFEEETNVFATCVVSRLMHTVCIEWKQNIGYYSDYTFCVKKLSYFIQMLL